MRLAELEEKILAQHVECVKTDAALLTSEGDLIARMQSESRHGGLGASSAGYVSGISEVARQKVQIYTELLRSIDAYMAQANKRASGHHC